MKARPVDVKTLEPVWVNPARAAIAADLKRFVERYPRCEVVNGRLRLKVEPRKGQGQ